jgi:hypothetical protein
MLCRLFDRTRPTFVAASLGVLLGCSDSPTRPIPDEIRITPSATLVQVGDSVALSASYVFGATNQAADDRVRWSSSDSSAFSVDNAGRGHALKYTGVPVTVTAAAGGVSGITELYVLPAFDSLVVTASALMTVGRTVHPTFALSAIGTFGRYYRELSELPSKVSLTTSNAQAVVIEADGSLRAVGLGRSVITAALVGDTTRLLVDVFPGYQVTPVSASADYWVRGVSDAGDVVATRPGFIRVLRRGDAITDLGACDPSDVNDAGQVACTVQVDCGTSCVTSRAGVFEHGAIRLLTGPSASYASGISESGTVFGEARDSTGAMRVIVWDATGLSYLNPGLYWIGATYRVNSSGHGVQVYGAQLYNSSNLVGRSFSAGLLAAGGRWSEARDVNDADDVVGTSERMTSGLDVGGPATVWRAANNWRPESPGYHADDAVGITESGQVVGNGRDGVYISRGGSYTILSDALADDSWTITQVVAVSHTKIIAAKAQNSSGVTGIVLIDIGQTP